jgi:MFS transporter, Spinster family, sphingosine-1-phosphate transporter
LFVSYQRYLLGVLVSIYAFNAVDRLALGLLLQDIKVDLELTDTQLGFLSGIAFALFYSLMGIPIARWADRGNRVTIISLATAAWSAAVALCATAGSFVQLLLIRVGVAIGEAGCVPPAHSLMADHFSRAERPRAVSLYMLGAPLSAVIGYFVAGWLNEFYGWRITFVLLGLPGLALALIAYLTLREPRRGAQGISLTRPAASPMTAEDVNLSAAQPSLPEVCRTLWANRTFRHLLCCISVTSFFAAGIAKWQPVFFIRSFGLQTGELGTWFTVIYGVGAALGTYWGGEWAFRRAAHDESRQLRVMAGIFCILAVVMTCIYLSANVYLAFALLALASIGGASTNGPLYGTIQTLVPERMRAMAVAIIYFFANLIGLGLGPLVAGISSDALRPMFGEESLRVALLMLCPGYLWGAWNLLRASRTVDRDLEGRSVRGAAISPQP